ncbi:hypothetical protein L211DRAFT_848283 [Terfezia boudieri ATCC MYA-4762]|uniref:Uncharacterized protein n=1 Tax=Terfezia boudieri ATCC MYA-4762 TaxID=1051890 RepID=A0A3N4LT92_9PEZI|nr:hypothetical protein L211DRAFT_848283 [Terfezia boudieri ATCC MYA-4762]
MLSDEQKRFYLDLEEQEELPDFQIPKAELEVIQDNQTMVQPVPQFTVVISVVPIDRQAYGRYDKPTEHGLTVQDGALAIPHQSLTEQEELAEGGADDCLSNKDVRADIEEVGAFPRACSKSENFTHHHSIGLRRQTQQVR